MIPSNHRQSERVLIYMVQAGLWRIDADGHVWWASKPRRAERLLASGYVMVRAMYAGRRWCGLAHRLVWQHIRGDIADGMVINHINGQKADNRPANLEAVTYSQNMQHAYRTGLKDEHGQINPAAKVSDHDVAAIRLAYACGGVTQVELAAKYGITFQHVSDIVRGRARRRQLGPVSDVDHRHVASDRDGITGRFLPRQFPEVRS